MRMASSLLATCVSTLACGCSALDWGRFAMDQVCHELARHRSGGQCVNEEKSYETYKAEREALKAGKAVPPPLDPPLR